MAKSGGVVEVEKPAEFKLAKQEIEFNAKGHKYRMGGQMLPSVTTVLKVLDKPALLYWAAGAAAEYMRGKFQPGQAYTREEINAFADAAQKNYRTVSGKALDSGKMAHAWIERDIYGEKQELPADPAARNSVESWRKWIADAGVEILEAEKVIGSQGVGVAGTVDFIARIGGRVILGDIKTSKAIYKEYELQVSAYRGILEPLIESGTIDGSVIVRIPKEGGEAEICDLGNNWTGGWKAFRAALDLHRWYNDEGEWKKI